MESDMSRSGRFSNNSLKQRRSGYEPSDTETDWQESPLHDQNRNGSLHPRSPRMDSKLPRSPLRYSRRHSSRLDTSPKRDTAASPPGKLNSRSPYKVRRDDDFVPPILGPRNVSPFANAERGRQVSPYKYRREDQDIHNDDVIAFNWRKTQKTPTKEERSGHSTYEVSRASERSTFSRRSTTAPRTRTREREQENGNVYRLQKGEKTPSPLPRNMFHEQGERESSHRKSISVGELNEAVANIKISRSPMFDAANLDTTDDSIGDIFFSRHQAALATKNDAFPQSGKAEANFYAERVVFPTADPAFPQISKSKSKVDHIPQRHLKESTSQISRTSSSCMSRHSRQLSTASSKMSDTSGKSFSKFTASRRKSQAAGWFSCIRRGQCNNRSPEKQQNLDETSLIQRAFVVENLRKFWADTYQPRSLNGFVCHKQEAKLLCQLVSHNSIPHILLKGPLGSEKRALAMALVVEIFGDACWNISRDLRYFQVQEECEQSTLFASHSSHLTRNWTKINCKSPKESCTFFGQEKKATQVVVPITSSPHHVELNVNSEPNAKYALMGLVKDISNNYALIPEVSNINFKPDYKVIVLYDVDKAAENIQHLIKWIMDRYTDACKLIICCEDERGILESVKNRCKFNEIDAPGNHEIIEVLVQIARKEDFDLPKSFAAKIAAKSKQNLRDAIMALEACKAHNYPFSDDQPIPLAWEEGLEKLAAEILSDPSAKRLFLVREKLQKLLMDFVPPNLILLKLVEQFLNGMEANSKKELFYWHAYYNKRLPTGTTALLKLEEFVAKFMSIHRKSTGNGQYE